MIPVSALPLIMKVAAVAAAGPVRGRAACQLEHVLVLD
jgi:hypothetical protein